MKLLKLIREQKDVQTMRTGKQPTRLYVGKEEYKQLEGELKPLLDRMGEKGLPVTKARNPKGKIYGLEIYLVDDESHFFLCGDLKEDIPPELVDLVEIEELTPEG